MGLSIIDIKPFCVDCDEKLTFTDMYYYDLGDGTARCGRCEEKIFIRSELNLDPDRYIRENGTLHE